MSRHDDTVYLRHMLGHVQTAIGLSKGKERGDLDQEPMLRYSLLHLMCILGEAANRVSTEGKRKHAAIPWRDIIGMRNMLIHGYDAVDLGILWETVVTDLHTIAQGLEKALAESTRA